MTNQSSSTVSSTSTRTFSTTDGETTGYTSYQSSTTTLSGTTVTSSFQRHGEPATEETRHFDPQGRAIESAGQSNTRVQNVSDEEQAKRDAEYEERIEDEYAKREGGA